MIFKNVKKLLFSSLELFEKLRFTNNFYSQIEKKLHPNNKFLLLNITVAEGCGGFAYDFQTSLFSNFDNDKSDFLLLEKGTKLYFGIQKDNLAFVEGSTLDFEEDIHKSGFVVKSNPNAELTCSCKRSFSPNNKVFDRIEKN